MGGINFVTRNCGIVLQHIKSTQTLYSILDHAQGVLTAHIKREDICIGACIKYNLVQNRTWIILEDVELIALPIVRGVNDLVLVHCALEICSYCMPVGSINPGVYELLGYLYEEQFINKLQPALLKKVFLCKLLIVLGLYPHEKKFQNSFFHQLATESIDNLGHRSVSMVNEQDVGDWLRACIAVHAQDKKLKTVHITDWLERP